MVHCDSVTNKEEQYIRNLNLILLINSLTVECVFRRTAILTAAWGHIYRRANPLLGLGERVFKHSLFLLHSRKHHLSKWGQKSPHLPIVFGSYELHIIFYRCLTLLVYVQVIQIQK